MQVLIPLLAIISITTLAAGLLTYEIDHDNWFNALCFIAVAGISTTLLLLMGLQ